MDPGAEFGSAKARIAVLRPTNLLEKAAAARAIVQ
jgi:hypothetical protein